MQRAMIGGIRSWDTTVLPSVFPDNSYKQHIYVNDQVCGQHALVLAELLFFWAFPWTENYCPLFFILPTAASCLITTHFKVSKYIFKTNFMYRPLSTMTNRYTFSSLFVVLEGRPVATVQQIIFCHPVSELVSSLSCHASHAVLRDQINLEPLICV